MGVPQNRSTFRRAAPDGTVLESVIMLHYYKVILSIVTRCKTLVAHFHIVVADIQHITERFGGIFAHDSQSIHPAKF